MLCAGGHASDRSTLTRAHAPRQALHKGIGRAFELTVEDLAADYAKLDLNQAELAGLRRDRPRAAAPFRVLFCALHPRFPYQTYAKRR